MQPERIIVLVIHCIILALFVILGIVFSRGKGASLIAGYNTAHQSEKGKYDQTALCRFMGRLMFALAACWILTSVGSALSFPVLRGIGMGLFLMVIVAAIIYANTGNRFKK